MDRARLKNMLLYGTLVVLAVGFSLARFAKDDRPEGNGVKVTDLRELKDFHSLLLRGGYELHLSQGERYLVEIETDENLQALTHTRVENGILIISTEDGPNFGHDLVLRIQAPDFRKIEVQGGVKLVTETPLHVEHLELKIAGAAETDLEVYAQSLDISLGGAGEIELKGKVGQANMSLAGAGELDAYDLICEDLEVHTSGAASAKVHATQRLEAHISGAGSLRYQGNPAKVSQHISGAGSIRSAD